MRRNDKLSINGKAMNERGTEVEHEKNSVGSIFYWYLHNMSSSCSLQKTHHKNISLVANKLRKGVEWGYYLKKWSMDELPSSWIVKLLLGSINPIPQIKN